MSAPLRDAFDATEPLTVGLEEEVVLLDPVTLDLAPVARQVVPEGLEHLKLEMPAAHAELATPPRASVPEAIADLARARADLTRAAAGTVAPAALAVHPFAEPRGALNDGNPYGAIAAEYGPVARRQLVCSLQVHVALGDADAALAVYNALRAFLPQVAALAAAAPFYEGRASGLASVRPLISGLLPRQGVPPHIESWDAFAEELRWGTISGRIPAPGAWWWELRPHLVHGTLELRVPDVQPDLRDGAAVAAVCHALVAYLASRHGVGDLDPAPVADWRIAENRWSALRDGVEGQLADLRTGTTRPTREILRELLAALEPHARALGCAAELERAGRLVEANGAMRLLATGGPLEAARYAAGAFMAHVDPQNG